MEGLRLDRPARCWIARADAPAVELVSDFESTCIGPEVGGVDIDYQPVSRLAIRMAGRT
jgi:hypothetical protein